jgi:hypothetical protein
MERYKRTGFFKAIEVGLEHKLTKKEATLTICAKDLTSSPDADRLANSLTEALIALCDQLNDHGTQDRHFLAEIEIWDGTRDQDGLLSLLYYAVFADGFPHTVSEETLCDLAIDAIERILSDRLQALKLTTAGGLN